MIPSAHLAKHGEGVNKNKTFKDIYAWGSSTIVLILQKREYLGHTINFKTRKHFKDKKSHYVPEDEWMIFENTHEAIIDQDTFDLVQKIRGNVRRYPDGWGETAPLTGLLYCADCGSKMYVHRIHNGKRISNYSCSGYTKTPVGSRCKTAHRIAETVVLELISEMLREMAKQAKISRADLVQVIQDALDARQSGETKQKRTRLATAKARCGELEKILCKLYEDNALGKLPDARYALLDAQYGQEQQKLVTEIAELEESLKAFANNKVAAERFTSLIEKYENFDHISIAMLNELVDKICVHERARRYSTQTTQEIEIYFNFIGQYVPPALCETEPTQEELEAMRQREELRERRHQQYLQRKASGKQKEYDDRYKAKRKAMRDARNNAIRDEDIKNGVFIPVSSMPKLEPRRGA